MKTFPTIEQVEAASHRQLAIWYRFLESAGMSAVGKDDFEKVLQAQLVIQNRIYARFKELGGMTTIISKDIGWDNIYG
jgi:hypothetical protein